MTIVSNENFTPFFVAFPYPTPSLGNNFIPLPGQFFTTRLPEAKNWTPPPSKFDLPHVWSQCIQLLPRDPSIYLEPYVTKFQGGLCMVGCRKSLPRMSLYTSSTGGKRLSVFSKDLDSWLQVLTCSNFPAPSGRALDHHTCTKCCKTMHQNGKSIAFSHFDEHQGFQQLLSDRHCLYALF